MNQWRSKQRIVAYDDGVVVLEKTYPMTFLETVAHVGGPIKETPFVVVYTRFENRNWNSTDEKP